MPFKSFELENLTLADFTEGTIIETEAGGKKVCLVRRGDSVMAFTAKCPHAGAPLCDGWVNAAGHVVCPLHKYAFDPVSGRNITGEGYKLYRYPVTIKDGRIFVSFIED
jgi:3-phenylpropionate/trans-cinnamate dioxygenase ferredoxin subunit